MTQHRHAAAMAALALTAALAGAALAQAPAAPPKFPAGQKDFTLAPAGTYQLDPQHAGVIARVSHLSYSMSVFRFDKATGTLKWDPAAPTKSSLTAVVEPGSITSNVAGFATALAGDKFLKAKAFPQATFVSSAFRQTDATHGQVDGALTLMGKTVPATFDVTLIGAGAAFGSPRIGVQARTTLKPQDFGLQLGTTDPIEIVVDVEFERQK